MSEPIEPEQWAAVKALTLRSARSARLEGRAAMKANLSAFSAILSALCPRFSASCPPTLSGDVSAEARRTECESEARRGRWKKKFDEQTDANGKIPALSNSWRCLACPGRRPPKNLCGQTIANGNFPA
jgi:hypothetical protein